MNIKQYAINAFDEKQAMIVAEQQREAEAAAVARAAKEAAALKQALADILEIDAEPTSGEIAIDDVCFRVEVGAYASTLLYVPTCTSCAKPIGFDSDRVIHTWFELGRVLKEWEGAICWECDKTSEPPTPPQPTAEERFVSALRDLIGLWAIEGSPE